MVCPCMMEMQPDKVNWEEGTSKRAGVALDDKDEFAKLVFPLDNVHPSNLEDNLELHLTSVEQFSTDAF